jgi:hypothetical protein
VYPEHGIERKPVPGVKLSPILTARRRLLVPELPHDSQHKPPLSIW